MKTDMIHISDTVYNEIAEYILSLDYETNGWWEGDNLTVGFKTTGHLETVETGVEYMGDRETYNKYVLDAVEIDDYWAYDENGDCHPCDFDAKKLINKVV